MHGSNDKIDNILISAENQLKFEKANYCIPGILSKCSAGELWDDQMLCKYASKSDFAHKCMYFIESLDGHCDCYDAQKDAKIIVRDCVYAHLRPGATLYSTYRGFGRILNPKKNRPPNPIK